MVIFNRAECITHTSAHPRLLAVENDVVPYNMRTNSLLIPAITEHPEKDLNIMNVPIPVDIFRVGGPYVMSCPLLFAKRYPGTFGVVNNVVLDYPSLVPVSRDHSTCSAVGHPLCGSLADVESADSYKINPGFIGVKNSSPDTYLDKLFIWIEFMEIGPNDRIIVIVFTVPGIY
jgi:hypothetical protein